MQLVSPGESWDNEPAHDALYAMRDVAAVRQVADVTEQSTP